MNGLLLVARLTLFEALRRRLVAAGAALAMVFILVFALGLHFVARDLARHGVNREAPVFLGFVVLTGLYAANFLIVMTAVLAAVEALAGEIASGVVETLAVRPVRRSTLVLGKWMGGVVLVVGYVALLDGGLALASRIVAGFTPPGLLPGLGLVALEAVVLMTLAFAGGTRLTALASGLATFGLYGIAFIGSWTEQFGTRFGSETARTLGIVSSLLEPSEALWQLAAHHMQPAISRDLQLGPFSPVSLPSPAMVLWAAGYVVVTLAVAIRLFRTRDL